MVSDVLAILGSETATFEDILTKKALNKALDEVRHPFVNIADAWTSFLFGRSCSDYESALSAPDLARDWRLDIGADHHFFHWELEFPEVYFTATGSRKDSQGFSAVIGNPPYVDSETMTRLSPQLRHACTVLLDGCSGNWDLFCAFIDRGVSLLAPLGLYSQILPNKLLAADYASAVQTIMLQNRLIGIRDYSRVPVFPGVAVYPIVPSVARRVARPDDTLRVEICELGAQGQIQIARSHEFSIEILKHLPGSSWSPILSPDWPILARILENSVPLELVCDVRGAATVAEAYEIKEIITEQRGPTVPPDHARLVNSGTIDRYSVLWGERPTRYIKDSYDFPVVNLPWLRAVSGTRALEAISSKLVVAGMTKVLEAIYDEGGVLAGKSTVLILDDSKLRLLFLLGLLNSRVTTYAFRRMYDSIALQGGYLRVGPPQIRTIPVPKALTGQILPNDPSALLSASPLVTYEGLVRRLATRIPLSHDDSLDAVGLVASCAAVLMNGDSLSKASADELDNTIDQAVGRLYGLTAGNVSAISRWYEQGNPQLVVA
jgi:hypothetical protein